MFLSSVVKLIVLICFTYLRKAQLATMRSLLKYARQAAGNIMVMSVAENMINYLIHEQSFALGYPVEAAQIVQASDYFLTSCLGTTLKLIAIVDTDQHPTKRIRFTEEELSALRIALIQFTYHAYGKRLGVSIEIWYIGKNASTILQETCPNLTSTTKYRFWVSSWAFDTMSHQVSCSSLSMRNWLRKRLLTKVLQKKLVHPELLVALS